jgi:hypothetical protein
MFTRAIVLGEEEFRGLVSDLIEMVREEFEGRGDLTMEEFEDFWGMAFEELLDAYGVDQAMMYLGGEWHTVVDGRGFLFDVVKKFYGELDVLLGEVKGENKEGKSK